VYPANTIFSEKLPVKWEYIGRTKELKIGCIGDGIINPNKSAEYAIKLSIGKERNLLSIIFFTM
jgi:hypothetical protein